jgi:RNA polymerase sigma factor (sigma-70 family)
MPRSSATTVLHFLRRLIAVRGAGEATDGQLLARFRARHDEAAFAELMQRHGPMVFGVCRRVLSDANDAEDAFQATFLVLVKKAGSLGAPDSVGNWLYGVAYRTALKARGAAAMRHHRERELIDMPGRATSDDVLWRDLRPVLDEEIQRLPARYRAPFVLCHLEGKTNEEAASCLGCPKGTILSRLARARERLRARLTKRGITLSTAALAALVTGQTASAAVPTALTATTLAAAMILATTGAATGAVSAPVLTLMKGVLQAMFVTKVKVAAAVLVGASLIAGGGTLGYGRLTAHSGNGTQDGAGKGADKPPAPAPQAGADNKERRKLTAEQRKNQLAQRDAYREQWKARFDEYIDGKTTVDVLCEASRFWGQAERVASRTKAEEVAACEAQLQRDLEVEAIARERFEAGKGNAAELAQARGQRQLSEGNLQEARKPNERISRLLRERRDAAKSEWEAREKSIKAGKGNLEKGWEPSRRLLEAELALADKQADRVAAWQAHAQRMKRTMDEYELRMQAAKLSEEEYNMAKYYYLDAEIGLERAKER